MSFIPLWFLVKNRSEECFSGTNRNVFEFIKEGVTEEEANSVGMSWKNAIPIKDHWTMAHIAFEMGLFSSVGQARKNGWDQPIEEGFTEKGFFGKHKLKCFFIWNPKSGTDQ